MRPLPLLCLLACAAPEPEDTAADPPEGGIVGLTTRDGVTLVADVYAAERGAPAVVLLHMTPLCCDRTDWPATFIALLQESGWAVIAPDRRGAGDSGGIAEEAYIGESGRYDVEAAVLHMAEDYGPIAIIGASNGTTSMLDYAAWAPGEGLPEPVALGFMTGGAYTENQTAMGPWLGSTPCAFTYSTEERAWSEAQRAHDTGSWAFHEYADGDHGTRMFAAEPGVGAVLRDHLEQAISR